MPIALGGVLVLGLPLVPLLTPRDLPPTDYFAAAATLGPYDLELGVSPDLPGLNTIDVVVVDRTGHRVDLRGISVAAVRGRGAPARWHPERLAPGHFTVDFARLPLAGVWKLRIAARGFERTVAVRVATRPTS